MAMAMATEMSRALWMKTVHENDGERQGELEGASAGTGVQGSRDSTIAVRITRTEPRGMRFMGRWCALNPLRCWWLQLLGILCAASVVLVVGIVVYRNSLTNKRQEILLKCENRKEVPTRRPYPSRLGWTPLRR